MRTKYFLQDILLLTACNILLTTVYALFSSLKYTFDTIQESTEECAAHICDFFQHSVALQWPDDDDGTGRLRRSPAPPRAGEGTSPLPAGPALLLVPSEATAPRARQL